MQNIVLIPGYGVPEDIIKDGNSRRYLEIAFNRTYEMGDDLTIILSGGFTDMRPPYDARSEAREMERLLRTLMDRPAVQKRTMSWTLIKEEASISTLENVMNAWKIISRLPKKSPRISCFCEATREPRMRILASLRLDTEAEIIPVDFDLSANRYVDREVRAAREKDGIDFDMWGILNEANLKIHHDFYAQRLKELREAAAKGELSHVEAVKEWEVRGQELLKKIRDGWSAPMA